MDKLKNLRNEKGYSLTYMCKKLGISKTFYWQIESNHRRLSYEMAFKIAKIFKTTPDELFYEEFKSKY